MMEKSFKYLRSLRFTLLVTSLLGVMFLLGLWIPQESLVSPQMFDQWRQNSPTLVRTLKAAGFLRIYTSPLMLALWVLFFLNLALVMWQRLPLLKKRIALPCGPVADPESAGGYPYRASFALPEDLEGGELIRRLGRSRYSVVGDAGGFHAVKNRLSPVAFWLFHLSFFLILVGGLTSVYTRFRGQLEVAEGETFQGEVERYLPTPVLPKTGVPPRVAFTVKTIEPQRVNGIATGLKVTMVDGVGRERVADVNRPYRDDHTTFIVDSIGVAPLFIVKDAAGREIDGAYAKLHVMDGKMDVFSLAGYRFRVRFYPDYYDNRGTPATRSQELRNPVYEITVARQGEVIASGLVPRNGSLAFHGHQLVMQQMPLWVRFSVIKEYGLSLIYAGFAVASLAVIWRFLFYRRELIGRVLEREGERRLVVAGRSEFYKSLAEDEFSALFSRIVG